MRKLRKIIGCAQNWLYCTEVIDLLPLGKTKIYDEYINCSLTSMRRAKFSYEYYNPIHDTWTVIDSDRYFSILNRHKTSSIKIRKAKTVKEKAIDLSLFHLSNHFRERLFERFINNASSINTVLTFLVENGYYLNDKIFNGSFGNDRFAFYEHDLRMLVIVAMKKRGLELITTYDPNSKWFLN